MTRVGKGNYMLETPKALSTLKSENLKDVAMENQQVTKKYKLLK
jgi:hypothetical protein